MPAKVAAEITKRTKMLVFSMGSGAGCDGQFIFAEDTHIIDAPASAWEDAMLALVAQIDHEVAWRLTEDETAEVDEDDWICEGTP